MKEQADPTLERIRQVRHEISAEFDHDPQKLVEYYMQLQERIAIVLPVPRSPHCRENQQPDEHASQRRLLALNEHPSAPPRD